MRALWDISKALQIPLDNSIKYLVDIPYTISFIIRKLKQIDSFNELPREKVPPDKLLWDGTSEEIDEWIDRVIRNKQPQTFRINIKDIEG